MRVAFAIVLVVHGLIHLLGVAKAFQLADLPQLTRPVSPLSGMLWLIAALLFAAAAGSIFAAPRWWWAVGIVAVLVSMTAIIPSWSDARYGVVLNVVAAVGVIFGFLAQGPWSLRAVYEQDVDAALAGATPLESVSEADLAPLPFPVQTYLRRSGVVGRPRVGRFRVRMHGRIRSGPTSRWMPLTAEQFNFVARPSRHFYLNASMFSIPVQGYHRYVGPSATMLVKVAATIPVAKASGAETTHAETVTMFNDLCVFAPAALIDPAITWEPVDAHTARATFTNAGQSIRAELVFNDDGDLTDFWSDDRAQIAPDGSARRVRWSTPVADYHSFGPFRLASKGEARWHEPDGDYAYIELTIDDVQYNLRSR